MTKINTKVDTNNWSQLDFLINNFYEIVEYKRGRGIYGDRVTLKRFREAESIFGAPSKLCEFYYLDANDVKELPRTLMLKIHAITRFVTTPSDMNILCNYGDDENFDPAEWAMGTKSALAEAKTTNFEVLNKILLDRYSLLGDKFLEKLQEHRKRQYFLASCKEYRFITEDYADEQINIFENLTRSV